MKFPYALVIASALLLGCSSPPPPPEPEEPVATLEEEALDAAKPGMVMMRVKKAPLRGEILPKFHEQAGVKITWTESERYVTLRMTQPMEWREALELVCQFTRTHAATDYQGRLVLKNGYGGTLNDNAALSAEEQRRLTQATTKTSKPGQRTTYPGKSGGSKAYRATTQNSRGSRAKGVKYNKGNDPTNLFNKLR